MKEQGLEFRRQFEKELQVDKEPTVERLGTLTEIGRDKPGAGDVANQPRGS